MVILVDENDQPTGIMPKLQAHERGALHRAFSIFIFDSAGRLLLQKRAAGKYHSGGLWTNTCCSHPAPGEDILDAALNRLFLEMGLKAKLTYLLKFTYKSAYSNRLTEHEIDHIFIGRSDERPVINPEEVSDFKYMSVPEIRRDIRLSPDKYTSWFRIICERFLADICFHTLKAVV